LVVASVNNRPVAFLLAVIRKTSRFLPSHILRQCVVYDAGEYLHIDSYSEKEMLFGEMLTHLMEKVVHKCFYIEFRNLSNAMFGYRHFRRHRFFGVNWLRVRNSLHGNKPLENYFSASRIRQIRKGLRNGAILSEAHTPEEIREFSRMLRKNYSSKVRKHFPAIAFFQQAEQILGATGGSKLFTVRYKSKIIGGSACLYSGENAYLWFSGGMRKRYLRQYPGVLAVWAALKDARERGCLHLEFMDVGLPFTKHTYREFVLRFGGKQSGTRRWFRFRWKLLNRLFLKLYG
jgi:hypothetical protein